MKIKKIKELFPFFKSNPEVVYVDSSMTSLKPQNVINKVVEVLEESIPSLSSVKTPLNEKSYNYSIEAMKNIENLVGVKKEELYFSQNATWTFNSISQMVLDLFKPGDKIILGSFEHASNLLPWFKSAEKKGIEVIYYELDKETLTIDLEHLKSILDDKVKMISLAHVYNTTGAINPIKEIREIVGKEVLIIVDAIQSVGHIPVNFNDLNIDVAIFTAHKMFGLYNSSVVFMKSDLQKRLTPSIWGGKMQKSFTLDKINEYDNKLKFQAGTQDLPGRVAFGEAAKFINELGIENIENHSIELANLFKEKLSKLDNIKIYNKNIKSSNVMFSVQGVLGEDVSYILAKEYNIYIRSGHNCVSTENGLFNSTRSLRASFYVYNTKEDVEKIINSIIECEDFDNAIFVPREERQC